MSEKIDFIVPWVDGNDPVWRQKKEHCEQQLNIEKDLNSEARYRDWELMKYWFRAVEKHAPWVNQVFFVTEGHLPEWLNTAHEKLQVVKHSDYIDDAYLSTFNSNVIELNFNKIEQLSNQFVLFNDDLLLNKDVRPEDFFKKGKPRDMGVFSPIVPKPQAIASIVLNNMEIINAHFDARTVLKKNFFKFFRLSYGKHLLKNVCVLPWKNILGFYDYHIPISYSKEYFDKVFHAERTAFERTFQHKFRSRNDINHWLVRYWQLCEGFFEPRSASFGHYYSIADDLSPVIKDITQGLHSVICLNDSQDVTDFERTKAALLETLERKYHEKSQFEK